MQKHSLFFTVVITTERKIIMGVYSASDAKKYEYQAADTFRMEKSGDRKQVVFLYAGEDTLDRYRCHRIQNAKFYTYVVDCNQNETGACPACADNVPTSNRIFVKMLDLTDNKVVIWDRAASFAKQLDNNGFMHYFTPLYKQKYEITKNGEKINTTYSFQSIGDSGISEEEYKAYLAKADQIIADYVRSADSYDEVKKRVEASKAGAVEPTPTASAWGAPPQTQGGWGTPATQQNNGGWGAQPSAPVQPSAPTPTPAPVQPSAPQTGWGQPAPQAQPANTAPWSNAPQGAWTQNPQG